MPLRQPLPGVWSSQYVLCQGRSTDIVFNDFEISNNGMHYNAGKTYVGLPFPFVRFYLNNTGAGTTAVKIARARDNVLLLQTVLGAVTATDGSFFRQFTIPNDNFAGITISLTKVGVVSVDCVLEGLTDSGLLPAGEIEAQPDLRGQRRIFPGSQVQPLGQTGSSPGTVVGR